MSDKRAHFFRDGVVCHLCGLVIPQEIFNCQHPLYGSIDHIVPRSMGGSDRAVNRAPAHTSCNHLRGVRKIDEKLREECFRSAVMHFSKYKSLNLNGRVGARWVRLRRIVRRYEKRLADVGAG